MNYDLRYELQEANIKLDEQVELQAAMAKQTSTGAISSSNSQPQSSASAAEVAQLQAKIKQMGEESQIMKQEFIEQIQAYEQKLSTSFETPKVKADVPVS